MRIYYHRSDVLITDEVFVWSTTPPRIFPVRELHQVTLVRGDLDPSRSVSAHAAGGALVLVVASWPMLDHPAAFAAAALVLAIPTAASITCWRMRPRHWELRAIFHGHEVVLFASANETTFGQVARALRRALEASGPSADGYELASR
jgi:hypothetical protein